LRRRRRRAARHSDRAGGSPALLLDALRQSRVHAAARRIRLVPRARRGRPRVHPAAGRRDVGHAVLALRVRRDPRRRGRVRPARPAGPARAAAASTGVSLLEAVDVRKFYGDYCALDGVTLTIEPGQFVSIIGPNGAGKTTLVNVLTAPTSGSVRFKGDDVAGAGVARLARLGIARSFQLVSIFPALTVGETLAVAVLTRLRRTA